MRSQIVSLVLIVCAVGCDKGSKQTGATGEGSAAAKPVATSSRPAIITPEMNETFELYVKAFETLSTDLAAAAPDCAKAVTAVERNARALDALDARGAELTKQMVGVKDPAAGEWFGTTYGPRFKAAVEKMGPLVESCEGDAAMKTAMTGMMARFPMMRPKQH
jgi:hypothetical protein